MKTTFLVGVAVVITFSLPTFAQPGQPDRSLRERASVQVQLNRMQKHMNEMYQDMNMNMMKDLKHGEMQGVSQ